MKGIIRVKQTTVVLLLLLSTIPLAGKNIKGIIIDKSSGEPLIGATIRMAGTNTGVVTGTDGRFILSGLPEGETCRIIINYVGYKPLQLSIDAGETNQDTVYELETDTQALNDVVVIGHKNLESDKVLLQERQQAAFAIENLGAKEMGMKGVSTVSDGVKKITGISIAGAGQLIVRGLGDRYSTTTMNGLPIASPNPDHKLIPLDLFPTSIVKNITVSKVYEASSFADYSGAHVDIGTKENTGGNFFSVSGSVGGNSNTLFKDFYHSDRKGSLLSNNSLDKQLLDMGKNDFEEYIRQHDAFGTSFSISEKRSLPDFGLSAGMGRDWSIGNRKLSLLASLGVNSDSRIMKDAFVTTLTAQGTNLNHFDYDSYTSGLRIAGLAGITYAPSQAGRISYTLFYARNAIDNYMLREGYDAEKIDLIGSNSVFHAYSLLNNQLLGHHEPGGRWLLDWSASYGMTGSDEPDRRQVMFRKDGGKISLFKLNKQETMRYFGELDEKEVVGDLKLAYKTGEHNRIRLGATFKDKSRDFRSVRFYYNLNQINPEITDVYNTDGYLNPENIAGGTLPVIRDKQDKYSYFAGNEIGAMFIDTDYFLLPSLLLSAGLRYEHSRQWVRYWTDASIEKRSELNTDDLFPAFNMRYTLNNGHSLRLAVSRTVTRPSFIEMAPFLYKASYGSAEIRGNENLQNGYNYSVDLRYEFFPGNNKGDMLSVTGYYKKLKSPIERVQESSGGSAVHSFRNASGGVAAGAEVEIRKELFNDFRLGFNGSYIYTNVNLPKGEGIYTDSERQLQGASPYLANADLSYSPRFGEDRQLTLAVMYNLQGPRINTVGIYEVGNVEQKPLHTLDVAGSYAFNRHFSAKLQVKNLLDSTIRFVQDIPKTGEKITVEAFRLGVDAEIGCTYTF
ncbi:MAG: TonB-dependent receptor [Mediterranea sp.]|jgi:outer membrane receptor protein involved in Fe transport|nr:TonB-dependent receptor [Mediterranea sp.]